MENSEVIFEDLLSSKRIEKYQKKSNKWINLYMSEVLHSKELYVYLHFLEVFLRNKINKEFTYIYGDKWYIPKNRSDLKFNYKEVVKLQSLIKQLKDQNKEINTNNITSNLNFGFWTNLFHKSYNFHIWQQNNSIAKVFPYLKSHDRNINQIHKEINIVRKLRNRVFHFENLIDIDLENIKKLLEKFIYGISGLNINEIKSYAQYI